MRACFPCTLLIFLGLLCTSLTLPAATEAQVPDAAPLCPQGTLCQRLGGAQALAGFAAELVDASVRDPRTAPQWERVDLKRVKGKLAEYLCVITAGRCAYENDDLRTIHAGHHIHAGQFYAVVEHLRSILDAHGVAEREKNELLALLAPSMRDVVEP